MILLPFLVFLVGLFIGSFLNVVIFRMNTGRTFIKGHSVCARCNRKLEWFELVPVFSFLALRGKCRTCRGVISFQYAIVELITALVFTVLFIKIPLQQGFTTYSWLSYGHALTVASLLIVIMIYDLKHKIIPDSVVFPFILLTLIGLFYKAFTIPAFGLFPALFGGVLVALPFFLLWLISKGNWMGFGDVKLALGIGWLLGLSSGFAALIISFWIGGIVGLFLFGLTRHYSIKSQIPFAPFLIAGLFIAGVWRITMGMLFPLW